MADGVRTAWAVIEGLVRGNAVSWRFVRNILIGFLPSAILGFILIKHIEALLGNAYVVAIAFIVGGIAILVIERLARRSEWRGGISVSRPPIRISAGTLTAGARRAESKGWRASQRTGSHG